MITLGLDTTSKYCSASLVDGAIGLGRRSEVMGRGHAERLAPLVQELLKSAGLVVGEIEKIVVCTGPGSFTGSRVALAFAKGLALPRRVPVVGIDALTVWAETADPEHQRRLVSVSDVRRGQLCWRSFERGKAIHGPVTEDKAEASSHITRFAPDEILKDQRVDTSVLAWLGQGLTCQDAPALPLYSRPPDAKLPGGIAPVDL